MTPEERREFLEEARDPVRQAALRAGADAARVWDAAHPRTLLEYLDFLTEFWAVFGPAAETDERVESSGLRL